MNESIGVMGEQIAIAVLTGARIFLCYVGYRTERYRRDVSACPWTNRKTNPENGYEKIDTGIAGRTDPRRLLIHEKR